MIKHTKGPWRYWNREIVGNGPKADTVCKIDNNNADARLIVASPIGFEVADAILAQEADGISRKDFIVRKAFEFMKQADPEKLEIYKEAIGKRIGGNK